MTNTNKRNYRFSIDLSVDCVLSQEERDFPQRELMTISKKMENIIGEKAISGTTIVYSVPGKK